MTTSLLIQTLHRPDVQSYMQSHNIHHIWLAGSFARGDFHDMSDIDIVYEEKDPHNPDLELLIMPEFLQQRYLHRPVDLIYKSGIHRHIRANILHDMIPVW